MSQQTVFDAAYWASQPPALQEVLTSSATATQLANEGYLVDVPIMLWGWDPFTTQAYRLQLGYPWVPSALLPPVGANPGYAEPGTQPEPGQMPFPTTMPEGWILVSTNPSDYPAYSTASATATASVAPYALGPELGTGTYVLMEVGSTPIPAPGTELVVGTQTGTVEYNGPFGYRLVVNG